MRLFADRKRKNQQKQYTEFKRVEKHLLRIRDFSEKI